MTNKRYKLIDTITGKVFKRNVILAEREKVMFNYAYALNGKSLRYV